MSVLPKSASFLSFFVVFGVLFVRTLLLGLNFRKILQKFNTKTVIANAPLVGGFFSHIRDYIYLLNPYNKEFTYESDHFTKYGRLFYRIL